ncbi:MAG: transcriptional regulator [Opitutia bacterium AMD-G1]|nr:MAG: transcriptional regulator [Opitutae bacterium AMD-G1]
MDAVPRHRSSIDPGLVPAVLWTRDYLRRCDRTGGSTELTIALRREDGTASLFRTQVLACGVDDEATYLHVERTVKFLLWSRGASDIQLCGHAAAGLVLRLQADYSPKGCRAFDANFFCKVFERPLLFREVSVSELPVASTAHLSLGRNLEGCRIGFDLGGSDRKCAALIDGKVVFSEEVKWDPYFQSDPAYHLAGIRHSLDLAASHLPCVDAIGGSSAGVYVNNKVRVASLFRGITDVSVFDSQVRDIFLDLARSYGVPFEVLNDGDVTALAGSMSLGRNAVLGVAMGTSVAAGYVDSAGNLTNWLSELAFVPVDYRLDGPADEWSGDRGCAVQYFSQQGVGRLLPLAGIELPASMRLPEQLEELQKLLLAGDPRALQVYEAIGIAFGYALAHFASFYELSCLLIMGRVTSGQGGTIIIEQARMVLLDEFPELRIDLLVPAEKDKRHGQAIAAASLPALSR